MSPAQARALLIASSPWYAEFTRKQLDYVREGIEAIERSRLPGEDFQRCMRDARNAAKLAAACGRIAVGGSR
jgi:hypothetical protein